MGPTASGKSAIALELARRMHDLEIVSADSMQVYRGMDIGTAKPNAEERAEVAHHLIDVAGPEEDWDVARFVEAAGKAVADIESRGHRALFVGGTGLYLHAFIDGFQVPGRWPAAGQELAAEADTARLYERLEVLDPEAAARIDPNNRRRVLRALEVTLGSGRPFSGYGPGVASFPATQWHLAGIWLPRRVVAARVAARFEAMMAQGLLDEVRELAARPEGLSRTARQALGYRELLAHVEQGAPLDQATQEAVQRTRQFARRQRMWWRRDPRTRWFGTTANPLELVPALLGNWADD